MHLLFETYPDWGVVVFHNFPGEKYTIGVVWSQALGGHLHLALFEKDLDLAVSQELVLLLTQTKTEQNKYQVDY